MDAPKYFEKPEEKEIIERQLKSAFSICKSTNRRDWVIYGLEPNQFKTSTMNPERRYLMAKAVYDSDEKHGRNRKKSCFCFERKAVDLHPEHKSWAKMIIISHEGRFWINFQMFCSILCLLSSYYYCSIMCHRYSTVDQMEDNHIYIIIAFESIFFFRILLSFFVDYKLEG